MTRFIETKKVDEYLIRIRQGEGAALDSLYSITANALYAFCFTFTHSQQDSEDALSDTYLAAVRNIDKFHGKRGLGWLYAIAKNACLTILRKKKRNVFVDFSDEATANSLRLQSASPTLSDESGILALSQSVLDENEFQIVVLHAMNGLKFKEIAALLDGKENTIRWQYNNAIKKVKIAYERREHYEE